MSEDRDDKLVDEHYGRSGLAAKILEALRAAGKDPDALTLEVLAPIDQLHARGAQATRQLAPRQQVLNLSEGRISKIQGVFEKPTTP